MPHNHISFTRKNHRGQEGWDTDEAGRNKARHDRSRARREWRREERRYEHRAAVRESFTLNLEQIGEKE